MHHNIQTREWCLNAQISVTFRLEPHFIPPKPSCRVISVLLRFSWLNIPSHILKALGYISVIDYAALLWSLWWERGAVARYFISLEAVRVAWEGPIWAHFITQMHAYPTSNPGMEQLGMLSNWPQVHHCCLCYGTLWRKKQLTLLCCMVFTNPEVWNFQFYWTL